MAERSKALESGHLSHLVRKGVGSNPTSVILTFFQTYLLDRTRRLNFFSRTEVGIIYARGQEAGVSRGKAEFERPESECFSSESIVATLRT